MHIIIVLLRIFNFWQMEHYVDCILYTANSIFNIWVMFNSSVFVLFEWNGPFYSI